MKDTQPGTALSRSWSVDDSVELYRFDAWGKGYFAVNDDGNVVVRPEKESGREIELLEVVEHLRQQGLTAPLVLRFSNLLTHRLRELRDAFAGAIQENQYEGRYLAVYPIKVNQQRSVVEEVYRYGGEHGFGLEVGSKPELLAVLAMVDDPSPRVVICNGFKDDDYIRGVTAASSLGRTIIPVVEKLDELHLILKHAEAAGVRPRLGVRVKLASAGAGRWSGSSGAKSKFGLFVGEILEALEILKRRGLEDCLELVHCHPGSQLHDIRRIKDAVGELTHVYAELIGMGATGLKYLDVGGGLAVDYDGSQTSFTSSMNYTLEEYANEVVYRVTSICNERGVPHPTLVTESGRAMAAFHSMLVVNVLGRSAVDSFAVEEDLDALAADPELPQPLLDLVEASRGLSERRALECYHDALQAYEQAMNLFSLGYLPLTHRGLAERLFWGLCARIRDLTRRMPQVPDELADLETLLADIAFCNFSLFQSLPDSWAIDQLFPITPIHRLGERPQRSTVLADMTCDSDGKIDRFADACDIKPSLPIHDLRSGEDYYLGIFLTGAYQETLGDLHNLFGDTHVAHVALDEDGSWSVSEVVRGDSAAEVLRYQRYDVERLLERLQRSCDQAVAAGRLEATAAETVMDAYRSDLAGYTYLEPEASESE